VYHNIIVVIAIVIISVILSFWKVLLGIHKSRYFEICLWLSDCLL